jgi:predicted helicase
MEILILFFLRDGLIIGYAETKDVDVDLEKIETSEQMKRYLGYSNLILTNYLSFRFYKDGEKYGEEISLGRIEGGKLVFDPGRFDILVDAFKDFLKGKPEPIRSGRRLSEIMGGKARRIRDNVHDFFQKEEGQDSELRRVYETVKKLLVHDLSPEAFADMYAQTLVYGLFVARYNDETPENFSRQEARDLVPVSNPFLQSFFDHIVGPRFERRLQFIVDELCAVFSVSDVRLLVEKHLRLFEVQDEKDPIIHFYEDFLKEYDSAQRKRMGAYYTPLPVARFIVRMVDKVLKEEFGLAKGLADTSKRKISVVSQGKKADIDVHRVQILDPAVGTATFLNETIRFIYQSFKEGQEGRWPAYVASDLLPRLHGFELMMAPYTIAHLKLGMMLRETGVKDFSQRLGVYLTNTLEEGEKTDDSLFAGLGLSHAIAQEAQLAGKIKHEKPIMVVIGNPPYSGVSSNETDYANSLINKYKVEPGGNQKLQERKHWLNDDYVKFIAFAEDLIEKTGDGVVAMITNHGYLDNPTFRGMRWHLAKTFDKIYVLDLHGNTKKKESAPDGGKDENVFEIQQGVAIIVAVKNGQKKKDELAEVFHGDIFGKRSVKFNQLNQDIISWGKIELDKKNLFFAKKNFAGEEKYSTFISVEKLFSLYTTGVVTMGDGFIVSQDSHEIFKRIENFSANLYSEEILNSEFSLGKNYAKWILGNRDSFGYDQSKVIPFVYRPFDVRYTYFDSKLVWRPRENVMRNFLREQNVGLVASRLNRQASLGYFFMTNIVTDFHILDSAADSTSVFPLYLYHDDGTRTPNFDQEMLKKFTTNLRDSYTPEDVLDYIYAVFHSPTYRETYKEFLKIDFPRVPAPESDTQFHALAAFGKQLRELHLLTSPKVHDFITTFPFGGSGIVDKVAYKDGDVWINTEQYFGNVPKEAWEFYIGGYQPAQKWLKDRKGRMLSNEDIEHYQQMIVALVGTGKIMKEIDVFLKKE